MAKLTDYLYKFAIFLIAVLPGIYLINYVGIILLQLSYPLYYILLLITGILYGGLLVVAHHLLKGYTIRHREEN